MAKYLTRRCVALHVVTLLFVSSCILATWWQYGAARGGNGLSWAYVFEWPAFAMYAVYMWWKLIHDQRTAFDRLFTARQHAAADAFGTPLHQIPGWALDKTLSRAVVAASIEAADSAVPSLGQTEAYVPPELGDGEPGGLSLAVSGELEADADVEWYARSGSVIDAEVFDVKVVVDEELTAYNRYLAELNRRDSPKHWGLRRRGGAAKEGGMPVPPSSESGERRRSELPVGDRPAAD
jgi:hypothetical protein